MGKHAKEEVNVAELRHELQSEKNISAKRMKRIVELERIIINADASYVKAQDTLKLHLDNINVLEHEVWAARQNERAARELLIEAGAQVKAEVQPNRVRLPPTRKSVTRKFKIPRPNHPEGDFKVYATVGLYDDGRPGEIFLRADRAGSFANGTLDAVALALSVAWQHGVPFAPLVEKLKDLRFEPEGMTGDPEFPIVTSPLDYVARWLLARFASEKPVVLGRPYEPEPPTLNEAQEDAQFRAKLARGGEWGAAAVLDKPFCAGCYRIVTSLLDGLCSKCREKEIRADEARRVARGAVAPLVVTVTQSERLGEIRMTKPAPTVEEINLERAENAGFIKGQAAARVELKPGPKQENIYTGPPCNLCGRLTRRAGACYICDADGTTTGCG